MKKTTHHRRLLSLVGQRPLETLPKHHQSSVRRKYVYPSREEENHCGTHQNTIKFEEARVFAGIDANFFAPLHITSRPFPKQNSLIFFYRAWCHKRKKAIKMMQARQAILRQHRQCLQLLTRVGMPTSHQPAQLCFRHFAAEAMSASKAPCSENYVKEAIKRMMLERDVEDEKTPKKPIGDQELERRFQLFQVSFGDFQILTYGDLHRSHVAICRGLSSA